jgi:hypothetical protein
MVKAYCIARDVHPSWPVQLTNTFSEPRLVRTAHPATVAVFVISQARIVDTLPLHHIASAFKLPSYFLTLLILPISQQKRK